jgi:hypothetical protein
LIAATPGGLAAPGGVRTRAERTAELVLAAHVYGAHGPRRLALPPHARRLVRDMMVIDIEAATIVAFRRTGRICVDAAGVRRLVIGRELRARERIANGRVRTCCQER